MDIDLKDVIRQELDGLIEGLVEPRTEAAHMLDMIARFTAEGVRTGDLQRARANIDHCLAILASLGAIETARARQVALEAFSRVLVRLGQVLFAAAV